MARIPAHPYLHRAHPLMHLNLVTRRSHAAVKKMIRYFSFHTALSHVLFSLATHRPPRCWPSTLRRPGAGSLLQQRGVEPRLLLHPQPPCDLSHASRDPAGRNPSLRSTKAPTATLEGESKRDGGEMKRETCGPPQCSSQPSQRGTWQRKSQMRHDCSISSRPYIGLNLVDVNM
jgi:hypothetical protein